MIRTVRRAFSRLIGSLFGHRRDPDLAEELDSHIQLLTEENIRRGLTPDEAHRRARVLFGGVDATKEDYRDQRGLPFFDTTEQDLRYAFRGLRRNPAFATVAILSTSRPAHHRGRHRDAAGGRCVGLLRPGLARGGP